MDKIKGKTVAITGGAVGLGYKYAEDLLKNGAKSVALLDLANSKGAQSALTLEKKFGENRVIFIPCDVTNASQFEEAIKEVICTFNNIDIFINNAGILDESRWEKTIDINVTGLIRGTFLVLEHMGKHKCGKGGTIVNIASIVGISSKFTPALVYSATKHAVIGFSRVLKNLEQKTGVRILVMCPGVTHTNLFSSLENIFTTIIDKSSAKQTFDNFPAQTVENVSQAMIDLIQKGKNGAIWVSEGGKPPFQIEIPNYTELVVPI
ncbi:15-hydroxyprostaglandin dehydrogenase NAD(+)-like [Vespula squamosa]|uniref:15-hydroxyprostaglandin dehydrogenase [NAD(+)] n=1 Tax=Vespula squamosa TaxID=30214 RepID=A0ABD2ADZ4_VESSQ